MQTRPSVEAVRWRLIVVALVATGVWYLWIGDGASGVLAGAGTILLAMWLLEQIFKAAILTGRRRLATALTFVKLAAFLGLGWVAFTAPGIAPNPVAFAVGVTSLPVAALWVALEVRQD